MSPFSPPAWADPCSSSSSPSCRRPSPPTLPWTRRAMSRPFCAPIRSRARSKAWAPRPRPSGSQPASSPIPSSRTRAAGPNRGGPGHAWHRDRMDDLADDSLAGNLQRGEGGRRPLRPRRCGPAPTACATSWPPGLAKPSRASWPHAPCATSGERPRRTRGLSATWFRGGPSWASRASPTGSRRWWSGCASSALSPRPSARPWPRKRSCARWPWSPCRIRSRCGATSTHPCRPSIAMPCAGCSSSTIPPSGWPGRKRSGSSPSRPWPAASASPTWTSVSSGRRRSTRRRAASRWA